MYIMQIHTFEVSAPLSHENFYKIQKELKSNHNNMWEGKKNKMTYWGLSDKGIIINMYRIKKKGFYAYSITYRISARRVMENDNLVGIFNTKNYPELKEKVNEILNTQCELLPVLDKCNLRRFDLCVNAELDNQEQVKAYIKTACRANIPAVLERYIIDDKPSKDDMTVHSKNYIAVSIYNKYKQMKKENSKAEKKGKKIYSDRDLKKGENIVRIEIRCMEGKIKALKEKYDLSSIDDFMENADKIGDDLFNYYLLKMFSKGNIYTLGEARKRIKLSGYKPDKCEMLNEFLTLATELKSIAQAMDIYSEKEIKKIIYMLDNIDVNYVTATSETAKLFNKAYIPTPIELFYDYKE